MDIVELLVLAAFILLPLIQGVLEKLGGGRRRELPPDWEGGEPAEDAERTVPVARREAPVAVADPGTEVEQEEGWSAGWGSWPSEAETLEDLSSEEVVSEEAAEEIVVRQTRLEDQPGVSEAARVTVPVVSLEPLSVERAPRDLTRTAPPRSAAATVRRAQRPAIPGLRSPSNLRQAIVLAEVLGPPRSLDSPL